MVSRAQGEYWRWCGCDAPAAGGRIHLSQCSQLPGRGQNCLLRACRGRPRIPYCICHLVTRSCTRRTTRRPGDLRIHHASLPRWPLHIRTTAQRAALAVDREDTNGRHPPGGTRCLEGRKSQDPNSVHRAGGGWGPCQQVQNRVGAVRRYNRTEGQSVGPGTYRAATWAGWLAYGFCARCRSCRRVAWQRGGRSAVAALGEGDAAFGCSAPDQGLPHRVLPALGIAHGDRP